MWKYNKLYEVALVNNVAFFPLYASVKDNYLFLKEIKNLVSKAGCELKVCSRYMNRSDRWMQVRPGGLCKKRNNPTQARNNANASLASFLSFGLSVHLSVLVW